MTYDVDVPKERYNTDTTREFYRKYRPEFEEHTIFYHFFPFKGQDSDINVKTASGLVYGSVAGITAAIYANMRHTKGQFSLVGIAAKTYKHGTPWVVAGAAYGVTLSLVTQLRQKESPANHMIAGYAAGTMFGSWYKSPMMGMYGGAITAAIVGLLKFWHDRDMLELRPLKRQRLFNNYRRGWLTDKPDAEGKDDAEKDVSFRHYKP